MARPLMRMFFATVPLFLSVALNVFLRIGVPRLGNVAVQAGVLGGGLVGAAIVLFVMGSTRSTFRQPADLNKVLEMPVLAAVPLMSTPAELTAKRRRRKIWAACFGSVLLLAAAWWFRA
jgi:hypothetical protein